MIYKKVTVRLDISGTVKQIGEITSEDELYAFSRKLRMYYTLGLIEIPVEIRDAMNDKLDKIYRIQQ